MRIGKFAQYLPEFGWEPVVLTADRVDGWPQTLPVEIDEAKIFRTPYFALSHFLSKMLVRYKKSDSPSPSSRANRTSSGWREYVLKTLRLMKPVYSLPVVGELLVHPLDWYRSGVRTGLELARKDDIDLIFSTYGPAICHLIASRLQKQTGIPWVAEFGDLWSSNHNRGKPEPFHFFEKQWEKRTMRNSALLITVSDSWARELERLHSKNSVTIADGFDGSAYTDKVPLLPTFTITYTGTIYPGKQDPSPLFQAIAELRGEGNHSLDGLEVRFFGRNLEPIISPLIEKYRVQQFVKIYGFVPFEQSVIKQMESTALLLLSWNDPKEKGVYTSKVYEYFGASRPVLAIGLKGSVIDELLARTGSGIIATEVEEIKNILVSWLEEFRQYGKISSYYHPDEEAIKRYSLREEAGKLAEVFDSVINQAL